MTNNNQECTCSKFNDLIIDTNGCKVHYLSPSQPSSVPVEEEHEHIWSPENNHICCGITWYQYMEDKKKKQDEDLTKYLQEDSPSTPEVSWEWQRKFLENGTYETGTDLSCMIPTVSEIITYQERIAILTERKRVNDILDGMKKDNSLFTDGSSFRCRTCTAQEDCECGIFNEAIAEAKHLINNTQ